MIAVRIPEEIRKYKEKIILGLNARQLISVLLTAFICVPLYYFGRDYISDDILAWVIILIAVPLVSVGFFRFNGMPMEKFAVAFLKYGFFFPLKRKYKVDNAFRAWQNTAIKEDSPKSGREKKKAAQIALQRSLERAVLIEEAEERGDTDFDVNTADLITVSTGGGKKNSSPGKKTDKDKQENKEKKKPKLQIQAEEIEEKIKKDSHYLPTKQETLIRKRWNLELEKRRKLEVAKKKKDFRKKK